MYSWLSVEVLTGRVIAELPDLECDSVSKQIGEVATATATYPLTARRPENWQRALLEGGSAFVLVDDERPDVVPWGGMVLRTTPDETDQVPVSLATYESYLGRRFVGDEEYDQVGAVDIIIDLLTKYVLSGSNGGIPMRIQVEGSSRGIVVDQLIQDSADKSVLSALQTLSSLEGGPEWTIAWESLDSGQTFTPVFRVSGTQLGNRVPDGLSPAATFEIPGPVSGVSLDRDYTDGNGANDVMATSTASGTARPQSTHVVVPDLQRPTFELRFTPDTDVDDDDVLQSHAQSMAAAVSAGTQTLALKSAVQDAPRLGIDWLEGDDIGYVVGGFDRHGVDTVPAFPGGITGTVRAVGWVLDLNGVQQVTPVLEGPGDN